LQRICERVENVRKRRFCALYATQNRCAKNHILITSNNNLRIRRLVLGVLVYKVLTHCMTDTMGRMHSDAQFAGSSSVPAHVEMMGFLGIGNNPMVGCTVACAVNVALALSK